MNLKDLLNDRQKKNLKRHYLKYRNSSLFLYCPLTFKQWLKTFIDFGNISIIMHMANTKGFKE